MMNKIFAVCSILAVSACAPTFPFGPTNSNGTAAFDWVGLHCVDSANNPAKDGSVAYGPFGVKTPVMLFKQINKDGTVSEVQHPKCF